MGYITIEQVDQAIRRQLRFYELLRSARDHVAPELQAVCTSADNGYGDDEVINALLDARLRLMRMAAQRAQANAALRRIAARTHVS